MSYKNLRNFYEIMRCIGNSRSISVGNSRLSNFGLVADRCLKILEGKDQYGDSLIILIKIENF